MSKISFNIDERNMVIRKIIFFKFIAENLYNLSKLAFQTGSVTKKMIEDMKNSKFMTSYPLLRQMLSEMSGVILDNPNKFKAMCEQAVNYIEGILKDLIRKRQEMTFGKKKHKHTKGINFE